jgi:hypothetical protein
VSQLLWPDKDREAWFSLGENHKAHRFGQHQLRNCPNAESTRPSGYGDLWQNETGHIFSCSVRGVIFSPKSRSVRSLDLSRRQDDYLGSYAGGDSFDNQ